MRLSSSKRDRPTNTQLFLIGNAEPMADLHSAARTALNPWPFQTQLWGKVKTEKQEGGEANQHWGKERRLDHKNIVFSTGLHLLCYLLQFVFLFQVLHIKRLRTKFIWHLLGTKRVRTFQSPLVGCTS